MTNPKPKDIPEWQKEHDSEPELKVVEHKTTPASSPTTESDKPPSRAELIEQASSWLEHQHIREAPLEGKISFLEGKGLTKEEVNTLLGLHEHKSSTEPTSAVMQAPSGQDSAGESDTPDPTHSAGSSDSSTPPIITYPEFLLKPPQKPPLVSRNALLRTAYSTAITAGALHFTSKYLVEPMFAELSSSRHQLHEAAYNHLESLNTKLEGVVSTIPTAAKLTHPNLAHNEHNEDTESEASDPSELFHRDIGIQTSEPPSPSSSTPNTSSTMSRVDTHAAKLQAIRSHLSALHGSCSFAVTAMQGSEGEMTKFDSLLDELKYVRHMHGARRHGFVPQGASWVGDTGTDGKEETDEIDRVKAEIKGVKGVLLSSRSFPRTSR